MLAKRLGVLAALVMTIGGAIAVPARPDASPPDSVSVSLSGGQARGDATEVVSRDGIATVVVDWSASCALAAGELPISHYWYVTVEIFHADGDSEVAQSKAVTGDTSASGQFRLIVKMKKKLDNEDFKAHVSVSCEGFSKEIKQQTFTLCRGASGASADAKDFIKGIEKGQCHTVERENGKGTKRVCDAVA